MFKLLTREQFKAEVFKRDKYTCVFCDKKAVDAHHIMDRALWEDGGYYLNNGASVCEQHHWDCEKTTITTGQVYQACGITHPLLPPQLSESKTYDKWGNIVLDNGRLKPGELFYTDGVQKIFKAKLWLFDLD